MALSNKKVLVTGGGGFMGSHLCEALVRSGARVRVIDNFSSGRAVNLADISTQLKLCDGNVGDENLLKESCRQVDAVVHTAFPMAMRERSLETGIMVDYLTGLFNLIKESIANNALFVFISSIAVYGDQKYVPIDEEHPVEPVMLHGALKLSGEYLCRTFAKSHGLKTVILRVADIYGPRNTRISMPVRFLINALDGSPLRVFGTGKQSRSYTYVDDYVKAVLAVLQTPAAAGLVLNVANGQSISMHELARLAKEVTGSASQIIVEPSIVTDDRQLIIDSTLAQKILHLDKPISMQEGLTRTMRWIKQNPGFYSLG